MVRNATKYITMTELAEEDSMSSDSIAVEKPGADLNTHEDESGGEDHEDAGGEDADGKKKKKKKKKPKKKKPTVGQTSPPTVGLSKIFKDGVYPVGQEMAYQNDTTERVSSAEALERERLTHSDPETTYTAVRRAGEVHRQVRQYAQATIKPGMSMIEIADLIENGTRALVEEDIGTGNGRQLSGIGFPTGLSCNEVAAHYTPNAGDKKVLQRGDVMKVDFGVHVNGRIVDSAFTMNFEPTWDRLLDAVRDATETGIREAGIDVRLCDVGEAIQEVMESYEVEVGGKTHQVKAISNLNGHSIAPYTIHGGKTVPIVRHFGADRDETKMEEGEYYAIETFGSTGRGRVIEEGACSHYALTQDMPEKYTLQHQSARSLLKSIEKTFGTLPFCRRYLDHFGEKNYLLALNTLVKEDLVMAYPPLVDPEPGAMTAQYEHTILLRPTCKEVVSRGSDY